MAYRVSLILASFMNLALSPWLYANQYPFIPSLESWCKPSEILNLHEIDSNLLPTTLDQGSTGTCYAHSAYYLLSHHLKQRYGPEAQASIIDFYHRSCRSQVGTGGNVNTTLMKLSLHHENFIRSQSVEQESLGLLQTLSNELNTLKHTSEGQPNSENQYPQSYELSKIFTSEEIQSFFKMKEQATEKDIAVKFSEKMKSEKFEIPQYNVFHFDIFGDGFWEREKLSLEVETAISGSFPRPVSLSVDIPNGVQGTTGSHAIVLTGLRTVCCMGICNQEYKVKNSWGEGNVEGWMYAQPLKDSSSDATYIVPCTGSECKSHILNHDPVALALRTGNKVILVRTLQDPSIQKRLTELKGLGSAYLLKTDAFVDGEFSRILRRYGAEDLIAAERNWQPIHRAAALGDVRQVEKVLKSTPEAITALDSLGLTAADIAIMRLHYNVTERLLGKGAKLHIPLGNALAYGFQSMGSLSHKKISSMVKLFARLHQQGYNLGKVQFGIDREITNIYPTEYLASQVFLTDKILKLKAGRELVSGLLHHVKDINTLNPPNTNDPQTLLHMLMRPNSSIYILRKLLNLKANPNIRNRNGATPLFELLGHMWSYVALGKEGDFMKKLSILVYAGAITHFAPPSFTLFDYLVFHGFHEDKYPVLGFLKKEKLAHSLGLAPLPPSGSDKKRKAEAPHP